MVAQQALVRAQLAVASARELLRRAGEDALSDARVLAEQPDPAAPARRRRAKRRPGAVPAPLQRNHERRCRGADAGRHACSPNPDRRVDWPEIATALQEQGERFVVAPKDGGPLIWGAAAARARHARCAP